jgi:ribosomal protein S4
MIHPGYLLNPGDMFQVDPDRVLFATGAPKGRARRRRRRRAKAMEKIVDGEGADAPVGERSSTSATPMSAQQMTQDNSPKFEGSLARKPEKSKMEKLLENAKTVVEDNNSETFTKRKQALGEFTRSIRPVINKINTKTVDTFEKPPSSALDDQLNAILAELSLSSKGANQESTNMKESQPTISKGDRKILLGALQEAHDNPIDDSKPYLTPWRPRPYMSAFAFIPRYLEVNQNICSAVYLRHPVARPGLAEIPTPFAQETNQLAFNWYLRRR